ncbi:MAG TPA: glucosidase [Blastocatellia bacterium]|nr:glucosidase [Blastocatellia bacterium]
MRAEKNRLELAHDRHSRWKWWGPYLSERAWGTVREDYSPDGTAWDYLPHAHAQSKAYRWGEDGIAGISDRHQYICFALALWNGRDPILKERLFGLSGSEGNHGEDVKEYYFYLDSTPTHSYMKFLYKYPQAEFPYERLAEENRRRSRQEPEFELMDTGVFDEDRYFDVVVEYAKSTPEDILIRISATNRGSESAELHLLPTIWFRNTWSWDHNSKRPQLHRVRDTSNASVIQLSNDYYGHRWLFCQAAPDLLFTENETNTERLYNHNDGSRYFKDGIADYIVHGNKDAINDMLTGTKSSAHYPMAIGPGETVAVKLRLTDQEVPEDGDPFGNSFDRIFDERLGEANEFYAAIVPDHLSYDERLVFRQAMAGLLWSKQFYYYDVRIWLEGDPISPPPPADRLKGRNNEWAHLYNDDIISMPDKWEYPWYAAWDLAFHTVPLALVDPDFAKEQLILLLREWYMHPNGQLPAYEWALGDVNPPVHAWAAWRVYKIDKKRAGRGDTIFLERIFHKLLLNFTWWVNRKDAEGRNVFQGGFLGLDNIGVFDRSAPLPMGGHIEQADGTSWMGMYCLNMLAIALELAHVNAAYEDVASKFWEHFLYIANAINHLGDENQRLWNEEDGFYYDVLSMPGGDGFPMKVRSMVGLIPLFAVETLEPEILNRLPAFKRRLEWFIENRKDLVRNVDHMDTPGRGERRKLSIVNWEQLRRVLRVMLDENEFLSPYGIRALSRHHLDNPYVLHLGGTEHSVHYEPAESSTGLFGGNSNWRGPVWFPVNFLIIESLQKYHHYFGKEYKVECPTGSGHMMTLWEVAAEISRRLTRIFLRNENGRRPVHGGIEKFQTDPHWRDLILFYEYFHGDNGAGIGASHQTGWTGLVAKLIQQSEELKQPGLAPDASIVLQMNEILIKK